jgi:hypothetical protein
VESSCEFGIELSGSMRCWGGMCTIRTPYSNICPYTALRLYSQFLDRSSELSNTKFRSSVIERGQSFKHKEGPNVQTKIWKDVPFLMPARADDAGVCVCVCVCVCESECVCVSVCVCLCVCV